MKALFVASVLCAAAVLSVHSTYHIAWAASSAPHCRTDLNSDNWVDVPDIAQLVNHFGEYGKPPGYPFDEAPSPPDGIVDITDISVLTGHFGEECNGFVATTSSPGNAALSGIQTQAGFSSGDYCFVWTDDYSDTLPQHYYTAPDGTQYRWERYASAVWCPNVTPDILSETVECMSQVYWNPPPTADNQYVLYTTNNAPVTMNHADDCVHRAAAWLPRFQMLNVYGCYDLYVTPRLLADECIADPLAAYVLA